ncbi:hypothetical protein EV363DRAFT_1104328, partial [Boletus edulis]
MPPPGWTTPEQKAFLTEELKEYVKVGGKEFKRRWPTLYQKWSQRWPERVTALPDVLPTQPLTDEQGAVLAKAWDKRQKQWMRWHAGAGENRAANNKTARLINDLMKPKTRTKKIWEIYAKSHYEARVKDSVPVGSNIVTVREKIKDALNNEPPEVIDALKLEQARQRAALQVADPDEEGVEADPLAVRRNIRELGPTLIRLLEYLAKKTAWSFSVVMGGPDPISPEDGNHITSIHVGTNDLGQDFSDAYDKYDSVFVEAFGEFLKGVYG